MQRAGTLGVGYTNGQLSGQWLVLGCGMHEWGPGVVDTSTWALGELFGL